MFSFSKRDVRDATAGAIFAVVVLLIMFMSGCVRSERTTRLQTIPEPFRPVDISASTLEPGLSVLYFYELYRSVNQLPKTEPIMRKGKPGPPILQLNHRFGKGENVFDSGESQGVGMIMQGFLHLDTPGTYRFQVKSNDGFALYLNDTRIITDPGVHADRLSDEGEITVSQAGWFPLLIRYYQRKGTAALSLYWKKEGAGYSVIPPEAYAHAKGSS